MYQNAVEYLTKCCEVPSNYAVKYSTFEHIILVFVYNMGGGAVARVVKHWTMTQKVVGSSLSRAGSWKTPPVHPAACGYVTLVGDG